MTRIKRISLAALVCLALGAIVASAAQAATEGPFFKVGGKELEGSSTDEITQTATTTQVLSGSGVEVKCTKAVYSKGADLKGDGKSEGAFTAEKLEFSGCTQKGNEKEKGKCEVEGGKEGKEAGKINSEPLVSEEGYGNEKRGGKLLTGIKPVEGKTFVKIKFKGECVLKEVPIELSEKILFGVICEFDSSGTKEDDVGSEVEVEKLSIKCPELPIKDLFYEKEGKLTEDKAQLLVAGIEAKYVGTAELGLAGGGNWGLFT